MSTVKSFMGACGTQNNGAVFGGDDGAGATGVSEKFNGSTWTNTGKLNTARQSLAGCGTQNSALSFGGSTTSAVTEKFNTQITLPVVSTKIAEISYF